MELEILEIIMKLMIGTMLAAIVIYMSKIEFLPWNNLLSSGGERQIVGQV